MPIARLADRTSRKYVIAVSLALFSGMTALCGRATDFLTLFLARVGVGVGEAGTGPASYSIIADLFEKSRRATAMAIYAVGGNIGLLLGFALGGFLAQHFGWRNAFFAVGLPGLLFALMVGLFLKEPPRGHADGFAASQATARTSLRETIVYLWGLRSFRHLVFGSTLVQFMGTGVVAWLPSMLERSHDMAAAEVGVKLGLAIGLAGSVGTLLIGGLLTDALSRRDIRWGAWVLAVGELALVPAYAAVLLAPTGDQAVLMFVAPALLATFFMGPVLAIAQALTPPSMRATASALLMLIINLFGLGLGPVAVGLLSDALTPALAKESLRAALAIAPAAALWAAVHFVIAARTLREDVRLAEQAASNVTS